MTSLAACAVSELVAQLRMHYAQCVEQHVTLEDDLARGYLADYLGCHPEVLSEVWSAWELELALTGEDVQAAGAWLHFFFWDPRPEDHWGAVMVCASARLWSTVLIYIIRAVRLRPLG